ncbi:MAG: hypothetical protein KKD77_23125, partial [Gammaproteobacteria bacterium]|nr:hypothetical protein [Gammaproteobacteria bacterium]
VRKVSTKKSKEQRLLEAYAFANSVSVPDDAITNKCRFIRIRTLDELHAVVSEFLSSDPDVLAVDTETEGLLWHHRMIGMSFSWSDRHNYYIPFRHTTGEDQLDIASCKPFIDLLLGVSWVRYVFHNYKFDYHKLMKDGFLVKGLAEDTLLAHYVLDENSSHKLKVLAERYIDKYAQVYEKHIDESRNKIARALSVKKSDIGFEVVPIDCMTQYACRDVWYTLQLFRRFSKEFTEDKNLFSVLNREYELLPCLVAMEEEGAYVDKPMLLSMATGLNDKINEVQQEVYKLARVEFNLGSTKQLAEVMLKKGITTNKYTPRGAMSTDESALRGVARNFQWIRMLLEYRALLKIKSSYVDPLYEFADARSRVHTSHRQAVAVTGRITTRQPSLQVIPKKADVRKAFTVPSSDYYIVPIDLSQVELRVTAHYSQDPILMHAYETGEDIHARTAAEIFGVPIGEVTEDQRYVAKPINFGIIYGIGARKLATNLEISEQEAQHYIDTNLARYEGVNSFITKTETMAAKYGYAKNWFGRIRRLEFLQDPFIPEWQRSRGYRQCVNFLIQGTAADMFKLIMIRCGKILHGCKTRMILTIHDELLFYWHKAELYLLPKVKEAFEDWDFRVAIKADISISDKSWGEKVPFVPENYGVVL